MPRPISIAVVYSFAIHLVLFVIADSLLLARTQPSIISTPLIVSIDSSQTTGRVADSRPVTPSAETEAPSPAETTRAGSPAENSREIEPALETPAAVDFLAMTATPRAVAVVAPLEAAPPVAVQAAVSPTQQEMLDRKLIDWANELHKITDTTSELAWEHQGQDYVARFTELPAADDMGIERVIVDISTEQDGKRLSSELKFKRLAFSNYAQFVNRWDPEVEIYGDEMDGRFHSNTEIYVAYDRKAQPKFHGKVTTASRQINLTRRRGSKVRDQVFAGGLQTGVRRIGLPRRFVPFPSEAELGDEQVHRFAHDTRITFHADGTFVWQAIGSDRPGQTGMLSNATTYLVADRKAALHVKGTVNGKVLVYSPEKVVIEGNLVYAQHPDDAHDADDYVGLVSDRNVDIAPPAVTGSGDLSVHAAIYAKRRFAVRRFRVRDNALFYLYGSLSAGSISATEPRYYTRIRFDPRLEDLRPPGFPVTDQYELESWDATWDVEPIE